MKMVPERLTLIVAALVVVVPDLMIAAVLIPITLI
jgi:hypothetical protein